MAACIVLKGTGPTRMARPWRIDVRLLVTGDAFRDLPLMTTGAAFKHGGAYDASMFEIDLKPRELHDGRRSRSTRSM